METNEVTKGRALAVVEGRALEVGHDIPFEGAAEVYIGSLTKATDRTKELYSESLAHFFDWLRDRGLAVVNELTPADLVAYRAEWQGALDRGEVKPSTVAGKLGPVRRFLLRCAAEGFVSRAVTKERIELYLGDPKVKRGKLPVYLEVEEIEALLSVITDARDRALIILALGSGLRVTELVSLKVGDLRPRRGGSAILEVREGKGQKARSFRIPPEVFRPVRKWVKASGRSFRRARDLETWLFEGYGNGRLTRRRVDQIVKGYVAEAGIIKPISTHTLRHTFATHYIASGGNPVALAEVLGHATLDTVMTYVHLARLITEESYRATWLGGKKKGSGDFTQEAFWEV